MRQEYTLNSVEAVKSPVHLLTWFWENRRSSGETRTESGNAQNSTCSNPSSMDPGPVRQQRYPRNRGRLLFFFSPSIKISAFSWSRTLNDVVHRFVDCVSFQYIWKCALRMVTFAGVSIKSLEYELAKESGLLRADRGHSDIVTFHLMAAACFILQFCGLH